MQEENPMATTRQKKSPTKRFRVLLERYENSAAAGVTLPFDSAKFFGTRAQVPVRGTINGCAFRSTIFPVGDGTHYMVVNKTVLAETKAEPGRTITVTLARDEEPRTVDPSADFARALKGNKQARATWEGLSYTHRKEYAKWIEEAKKPETRERRIAKAVEALEAGKKERYDRA
jgi:hypothetical protein